jgi:SecD/SecF fusion protein
VEVPGTGKIESVTSEIGSAAVLTLRIVKDVVDPTELDLDSQPLPANVFHYPTGGQFFQVGPPILDASDISYKNTRTETRPITLQHPNGDVIVSLALQSHAMRDFSEMTTAHLGQRVAICLDDVVISAPTIAQAGIVQPVITGMSSRTEAEELTKILRAGPLPVSLDLDSQSLVSPTLGAADLERGGIALLIGLAMVALVLGAAYADHLAMCATFIVCMALQGAVLFALASWGLLTLSLASLSGLVVLIGISVDNLILVFEEYRRSESQELAFGIRDNLMWLTSAFRAEFLIISLANATTVLTLLPLYLIAGPIKDLVQMMMLGIATAVVVNVWFAQRLIGNRAFFTKLEQISRLRPFISIRADIFSRRSQLTIVYIIMVLASLVGVTFRGLDLGLDLQGGSEIIISADEGIETDRLRQYSFEYYGEHTEVKQVRRQGVSEAKGIQYAIRIPQPDAPAATQVDPALNEGDSKRSAEDFVEYVRNREPVALRLHSIDLLGPTVVALNQTILLFSVLLGLFLLGAIPRLWYGRGYAAPVLAALIGDGMVVLGVLSVLDVPISIPIIAAVLTVIGYSINDSIVLCGHIYKEWPLALNELEQRSISELSRIAERPELETSLLFSRILRPLSQRVVLTSATTSVVAAALLFTGGGILQSFGVVILVGTVIGTISSISLVAGRLEYLHIDHTQGAARKALQNSIDRTA